MSRRPETLEALGRILAQREFAEALLSREPKDRETLYQYVALMGFKIPRVAACLGHDAPLDFFADVFFQKVFGALLLGARGSGKTRMLALLNHLISKFRPGTVSGHIGAISRQSSWGFEYLRDQLRPKIFTRDLFTNATRSGVIFKNGSQVLISTGSTETGVSAIRCHRLVLDEIDQWTRELFETAQMMVSGTEKNPGQRVMVSTRYAPYGLMNELLEAADQRNWRTFRICIWEVMQRCERCEGESCALFRWENPFTGEDELLCRNRGLRSDGFIPRQEVIREFWSTDPLTWAVQKLLYAPSVEKLLYPDFAKGIHYPVEVPAEVLEVGTRCAGVDWGFDHPFALAVWIKSSGGKWYAVEEHRIRHILPEKEIETAWGVCSRWGEDLPFFCGKDEPKSIRAWQAAGLNAMGATSTRYDHGVKRIKQLMSRHRPGGPRFLLSPDCPMTAQEFQQMHRTERGGIFKEKDDLHDASRYGIESAEDLKIGSGGIFRI